MRPRALLDWLTIALFVAALVAPAVDQLVRPDHVHAAAANERRRPNARPELPLDLAKVAEFPRRYEAYFNDTFGLRDVLLTWNAREQWIGLGVTPSTKIDPGQEGWAFLGDEQREVHRGLVPFSEDDLDGWVRRMRERRDFLAARGCRYLVVLCPSKETIYPERTLATWSKVGPTRMEQLVARLEREPDVPFLDLRPALLAAKAEDRADDWVYPPLGTHWNGRGSYAAYHAIMERLARDFPELQCVPRERCSAVETDSGDNLATQLYLVDRLRQNRYLLQPAVREYHTLQRERAVSGAKLVTEKDVPGPRLLWFHDSFGLYLEPLVCESFPYVQAHWTDAFKVGTVSDDDIGLVLETHVERRLLRSRPYVPVLADTVSARTRFDELTDVAWREDSPFPSLEAYRHATIERGPEGLLVMVRTRRGGVLLPAIDLPPGSQALLRIEANCPSLTSLDVYVRPAGARFFQRANRVGISLDRERPTAVLRLPVVGRRFEMLIRYQSSGTSARLRSLEVRRGPVSAPGAAPSELLRVPHGKD